MLISNRLKSRHRAFTLIELIVTVTIIALISVVAILGFGSSQARARDARRIADVGSLGIAIESFRTANGTYPIQNSLANNNWQFGRNIADVGVLDVLVNQGLINTLPRDPKPATGVYDFCGNYAYVSRWDTPNDSLKNAYSLGNRTWALYLHTELSAVSNHSPLDATVDQMNINVCTNTPGYAVIYGAKY